MVESVEKLGEQRLRPSGLDRVSHGYHRGALRSAPDTEAQATRRFPYQIA